MVILYGIPNCNTMKKARQWLEEHGIEYRFHNYKKDGVDPGKLDAWLEQLGWETLVNRRSTTWRKLPEEDRDNLDTAKAKSLMLAHPSLIKRPVLEWEDGVIAGFDPRQYGALFV